MRAFISPILIITLLVLLNQASAHEADEASQAGSTFLLDNLNNSRGSEISHRYTIAGDILSQADGEEYDAGAKELKPKLSGAGGYYGDRDWQAYAALYLWFVGMDGEIGRGNFVADVDIGFGDIWDNLDFGIQAHVEVWWKKLIFFTDPMYMRITSSNSNTNVAGSLRSDLEVNMFMMDFAAGYRVAEIPLGSGTKSNRFKTWPVLNVDLYGGGRLVKLDTKLDLTLETPIGVKGRRIRIDETWFDFIVGSRLDFDLTENLILRVRSDIGGFGLGFSSDIDWNFAANVGYQLPWWGVTPYVGYRVLYLDYDDESGSNKFIYKVWHTGPQIGLGVRF